MRARIKAFDRATNRQKKMARELVQEEMRKQAQGNVRRVFKLLCLSLNEEYGFGKKRLGYILARISENASLHDHDEVFWTHVDQRMEQIGMEFTHEDYEEVDR
jgi:hypothetical protein